MKKNFLKKLLKRSQKTPSREEMLKKEAKRIKRMPYWDLEMAKHQNAEKYVKMFS